MRSWPLVLLLAACSAAPAAAPPEPVEPEPASSSAGGTPGDLPTPPQMIPDPAVPVPDVVVPRPGDPDVERVRELIAEGRSLRVDSGRATAAVDRLRQALTIDSLAADAYWELGWAHQELGRWDQALAAWERLPGLDPDYPGLDRHLPILRMRNDRASRAGTAAAPPLVEELPRPGVPLRVAAVGDIQLGTAWPAASVALPPGNAERLFARIRAPLDDTDITFGNLETVLADSGDSAKCRPASRNCYAFRAPTSYAATLRDAGFDVLSANNNHAGDFGETGRRATVAALDANDLRHSGPASGVASWQSDGLRIALIAFSTGEGPFRVQDLEGARALVQAADRGHDLVFVSFHGGAEGADATRVPRRVERAYGEDRGDVYAFGHAVVDAGADLVLGHGPHVLRGMEVYRGRLIAYSLGNFASWHGFNLRGPLGVSAVLQVTLAINGVVTAARVIPVVLDPPGIPTPDPDGRAIDVVRRLSQEDFGDALFDPDGRYVRR